jgi:tRNA dimethylallyltransferase
MRALEIVHATGSPVPELRQNSSIPSLYIGLHRPRRELWAIADRRTLEQVRAGLSEETRLLLEMGYSPDLPSMQGFGYRQMASYLRGEATLAEAIEGYRVAQHRYIRRQMTWFGRDERIVWLDADADPRSRARELVREWLEEHRRR